MTSFVSLLVTQPHGYHLVSEKAIDDLCCAVDAIEDTLQWTNDFRVVTWEDADRTAIKRGDLCKRAVAAGASPCVPNVREDMHGHIYPHVSGPRFVIPPAIAATVLLVATARNFAGGLFGSARHLPSATYENVGSTVIWCTLEALRERCTTTTGAHAYFPSHAPAVLAFPSLAQHFPLRDGIEEVVFKMGGPAIPLVLPPDSNAALRGAAASSSARFRDTRTLSRIDGVKKLLDGGHSVVLEMAGAGCPRNDLTIVNPGGVSIGVEFKSYRGLSIVGKDVLEKRCFQMGYNKMSVAGRESFVMEVEKHDNSRNLLGRFITLLTEKKCGTPTKEFLLLCSPIGDALLPSHTTVEFRERTTATPKHGSDTLMETAVDGARGSCHVVCLHLDVEDLLYGSCAPDQRSVRVAAAEPCADDYCIHPSTTSRAAIRLCTPTSTGTPMYVPDCNHAVAR